MTSKEYLIFNFERPETPTGIQGTFAPPQHIQLAATNSLDLIEHGIESPATPTETPGGTTGPKGSFTTDRGISPISQTEDDEISSEEAVVSLAQQKIEELEKRVELLERELRLSQERSRKLASQGRRIRRLARSGDLFRRNQGSFSEFQIDVVKEGEHVGEYVTLTVSRISGSWNEANNNENGNQTSNVPLYLRRFEGQTYTFGTKGVSIGCGNFCGIWLPDEARVKEFHAVINWDEDTKEFRLSKGDSDGAEIFVTEAPHVTEALRLNEETYSFPLRNGMRFRTGMIEWTVSPVPRRRLIVMRMFEALRNKDIEALKEQWLFAESWNDYLKQLNIDKMTKTNFMIDSNAEEDPDYRMIDEQAKKMPKMSDMCLELPSSRDSHLTSDSEKPGKFCLLHVAVDYSFVEGVEFILQKEPQVNKQCGSAKLSPLHIAVKRGNLEVTRLLLFHGADVERTDSQHLTAVSLAETYQLRKRLLSSLMLCAAADGGDFEEVKRLIENGTSPNAKALCHKAPLHLASLQGHVKVVEYLLENEAFINITGGRRDRTALHYASIANNVGVVKVLLRFNADQEMIDNTGYTALNLSNGGEVCRLLHQNPLSLCLATQAGDIEEVKSILDENSLSRKSSREANVRRISHTLSGRKISHYITLSNLGRCLAVDQRNEQGHAPIHLASAAGNMELVQLLVSHGATVDLTGGLDKWTALFYAALAGHSEVVGFLLAIGADTSGTDAQGLTIMEHVEQNIEDMKEKIEQRSFRGNSIDQDAPRQQSQSLMVPAQLQRQCSDASLDNKGQRQWLKRQLGRLQQVLTVLQSGQQKLLNALEQRNLQLLKDVLRNPDVKINEPLSKHSQTTALLYAAREGMPEFVQVLLEHKANATVIDNQGLTPIHVAAKAGHEDVAGLLLQHGVDINIRTNYGRQTPIHIAALEAREEVVKLLVKSGADLSAIDAERNTPFDLAEDLEIKSLIASGSNLLYIAIAKGNLAEVTRKIQQTGMSANTIFSSRMSALEVACQYEQFEQVDFLLKHDADVNYQGGPNSSSPLHVAVQRNSLIVAKMLVENGAKLSATDTDGKTPFEVATSNAMRKVLVDARPYRKMSNDPLIEEPNPDSSGDEESTHKNLCRICFDNPANTIVLPCGHQVFCKDCASKLKDCAFDRRPISQVVPVFRLSGE